MDNKKKELDERGGQLTSSYQHFYTKQNGPHPSLIDMVKSYAQNTYLRPIANHQLAAFHQICQFVNASMRPVILDSGCGTGLSTTKLAQLYPDHIVVGVDKSAARLSRNESASLTNLLLVRADVIDLWRLLEKQLPIVRHYLFYPNPWPKISQIKRRFYAHPVFKTMIMISPYLEVRTNWIVYAEELIIALRALGQEPKLTMKTDSAYMSLFEKKYVETECPIYIVTNQLSIET